MFFDPRSIFDPVMAVQRSNFGGFWDFSTLRADIGKTIKDSDMGFSPACSLDNSLLDNMYFEASAPLLSPHSAWEAPRSRPPPGSVGGRPATMGSDSALLPEVL